MQFLSSCPVVRDGEMSLFERITVGGRERFEAFPQRVLWLRQSECEITLRHRGVKVDRICTINDWNGYLSSIYTSITHDSKIAAKKFKIRRNDALTIDIDLRITDQPALVDMSRDAEEWNRTSQRKKYLYPPTSNYGGSVWYVSKDERLEPVLVDSITAIYSTGTDAIGKIPKRVMAFVTKARELAESVAKAEATP